ncbi:MAG: hypothetical protein AAF605_08370 [Myxococcota bacterium]
MTKKKLDRAYRTLTADDRFHAALAAAARKDLKEVARLGQTCPRVDVRVRDPSFTRRTRGSRIVAMRWLLLWEIRSREFHLASTLEPTDDKLPQILFPVMGTLLGVYLGLCRFCSERRINESHLLDAWVGGTPTLLDQLLDPAGPLPEDSDELPEVFHQMLAHSADQVAQLLAMAWEAA